MVVTVDTLRRLVVAATGLIGLRLASAVAQYALNIYLARLLPIGEISSYWVCTTVVSLAAYLASFGYQTGAVRFLPGYLEQRDYSRASGYVRQLILACIVGPALLALLAIAASQSQSTFTASTSATLVAAATLLLPMCLALALSEVIRATHRPFYALLIPSLAIPAAILVATLTLSHYSPLTAAGILYLSAIIYAFGCLALWMLGGRLPEAARIAQATPHYASREWLTRCITLGVFSLMWNLSQTVDFLIVGARFSAHSAAIYGAVVKILAAQQMVSSALTMASGSHVAAALARHDSTLRREVATLTAVQCAGMLACTLTFLVCGRFLLGLFGDEFRSGYPVLCILSIGLLFRAAFGPCELLLSYGDRATAVIAASVIVCFTVTIGGWLFLDTINILNVALLMVATFSATWILLYLSTKRYLRFDPSILSFLRS